MPALRQARLPREPTAYFRTGTAFPPVLIRQRDHVHRRCHTERHA